MTGVAANPPALEGAQLAAMLQAVPARIALLDRQRCYVYVNPDYAAFAGLPAHEILGRSIGDLAVEHGFAAFVAEHDTAPGPATLHHEGWHDGWHDGWHEGWVDCCGERRFLDRIVVALPDASGAIDGYFLCNRDLTELKRSEQAVARLLAARAASDTLNAAIIASALDCFITIDADGLVVEFNPAAERVFGRRRADVLGQRIGELIVPPALRQRHTDGFARYLRTGEAHVLGRRIEVEAMRADGAQFPVELAITEVKLPDRRLFTAHLRELTEVRASAVEIQVQREALHQSEKMAAFGSLLAGVAHELNNPLSIVIGNALMLAEEAAEAGSALAARATRVQAAAERCGAIVRSFLAMARRRDIVMRPVEIPALIAAALQLLAYGLRSDGVTIQQDLPPDLPMLCCDPDQIQQVLSNLLLNACQALQKQPPPRSIHIVARADSAGVRIEIADNGPGIANAIRPRLFDPFFTTKPPGAGSGIGLKVSRGIAEAHGGSLTLAAAEGPGARFVLSLPYRPPSPAGAAVGATPETAAGQSALIVDDEPDVAALLAELITGQGYRCDCAASGAEAQAMLERRDYDVILCDVRMPGIDGPALFGWIVDHAPHLIPRVAFVTGDTLGATASGFVAGAGRPLLEKPFLPHEVRHLLATLRESARIGDAGPVPPD